MSNSPDNDNPNHSSIEDLSSSEIRYRRLFESARDGILILDAVTRKITDVNPFMSELLGYMREYFLGKELWEIGLLKDEQASIVAFQELQNNKYIRYEDLPLKTKNGEQREVEFISNVYTENDRQVIQCNIREITTRNLLMKELRQSEIRLANAQRIAHVGNWELDLINDRLYWSDEILKIFGLDRSQFEGNYAAFSSRVYSADAQLVQSAVDDVLAQTAPCNFEHRIVRLDGEVRTVCEVGELILGESGKPEWFTGTVQDITERKKAEAILRTSEARFRQLVESNIIGIIITNLNGSILEANDVFLKMVGYGRDELLAGKVRWDEMTPSEFRLEDERTEITEFGSTKPHEKEYIRKDGKRIPVLVGGTLLEGLNDTIIAFVLDISKQKQAEEAIRQSEAAHRQLAETQASILDTLPAHICLLDSQGVVLTVNAGWKNYALMNCYGGSNFGIGTNYLKVCENAVGQNSANAKEIADGLRAVLSGISNHFECDYPCNSPDKIRWFRLMVTPLSGETSAGLVVMHIDTTDQRQTEELLRKAESNYRHLIESSPGIVYLNEPNPPYSTIYVSPNIEKFGYTAEEWYATPDIWSKIIYFEDRERVLKEFETAVTEGLESDIIYRIMTRDGSIHWWQDKGRFVSDEHGNRIGWQGIVLDITATKELEQQLRQAQKLESVGLLAGGIAHDFNNMLTAINGYSDLILRQLKNDDPLYNYVEEIKKAGQRSATLTNQLLAFSRQQVLNPVVINLNEIIGDTMKMLQRVISENIQLTTTLNPKLDQVKIDPGQLSQILMNLAVNAGDAMPQGGKLTIETSNIFLNDAYSRQHIGVLPGAYVMLAFSDTGFGMSEEIRQHIFEPFFTTKEVGQGTGLGLATVHGIVKQSGGNIEVYSEQAIGTTFKLYFPRVVVEAEEEVTPDIPVEISKGTETILLVEDEELVRNLSTEILKECGYTVIAARNGLEALEIFDKGNYKFDLLMTDIVMPQMGGRILAEKLLDKSPNLLVLYTSGYTDDAVVRHGVLEINTNFIQKPFSPDALAIKVRKILDNLPN